jgi:Zn-dependent protease with chaperone function
MWWVRFAVHGSFQERANGAGKFGPFHQMSTSANAIYYDAANQQPREARVEWTSPEALQVEVAGERQHWSVRNTHFSWEISAEALRVSHGDPPAVLIIRDPATIRAWTTHFGRNKLKRKRSASVPWLIRIPLMLPLGFIAAAVAVYLWVLPFAAERLALMLPPETDVRLGEAMYTGMKPTLHEDTARSAALQRFGDRLHLAPSFKPTFHVVEDEQVNAFALPGGHIVVYTALLDKLTTPEELAALLAHESTHVEKRHSTRAVARDLSGTLFLSLMVGDATAIAGIAAKHVDELRGLSYSRALESEADAEGIERLKLAHVDPHGMVDLLHVLGEGNADVPEEVAFLSTHPLTKERLAMAEAAAAAAGQAPTQDPELLRLFNAVRAQAAP